MKLQETGKGLVESGEGEHDSITCYFKKISFAAALCVLEGTLYLNLHVLLKYTVKVAWKEGCQTAREAQARKESFPFSEEGIGGQGEGNLPCLPLLCSSAHEENKSQYLLYSLSLHTKTLSIVVISSN